MHACMHTCMHTYIHTYTHRPYIYLYIRKFLHTFVYIYVCRPTHMRTYTHVDTQTGRQYPYTCRPILSPSPLPIYSLHVVLNDDQSPLFQGVQKRRMEPRNGDGPVISLGVYGALKWLLIWLLANAFAFYILMQALVGQRTHQPLSQFMTTTPKKPIDFQALANVMGKSHENKISEPLGDVELKWVTKAKRSHEQMVQFMLGVDPGKVFIKKHRADPPNVVTDKSDSFVLNNKRLCGNQSRLTFLFCIFSKPQNFKQRLDLRETWAQPSLFAK